MGFDAEAFTELASDASDWMGSGAEALQAGGELATGGGGRGWGAGIAEQLGKWGSGLSDFAGGVVGKVGKAFTDDPLSAFSKSLGIGATAMGIGNQMNLQKQIGTQTKNIERGQAQASAAAAPAVAFGTETLNRAAGGNLTPAMQAQIDQWVAQKKADAHARLASMGMGNSTAINQLDQLIEQQAMSMKGQMLSQQQETGLAGINVGVGAATGSMGVSQQQQQTLLSLIAEADKALGQMTGRAA